MKKFSENVVSNDNVHYVQVTPDLARKWLKRNYYNRTIRPSMVQEYAYYMEKGLWGESDSMIVIAANGALLNGQHRLLGVVASGKTIGAWVRYNANFQEHIRFDHGYRRSLLDALRLELQDNTIRHKDIEVLKAVIAGLSCKNQRALSPLELIPYYRVYGERIRELINTLGEKFDTTVLAVLAKAISVLKMNQIERFCDLLVNSEAEHPSQMLVQYFLGWLSLQRNRRQATRREIYNWTQHVLKAFLASKDNCTIPSVSVDLFPLETV